MDLLWTSVVCYVGLNQLVTPSPRLSTKVSFNQLNARCVFSLSATSWEKTYLGHGLN